jgi:GAF domain-containing protein
LPLIAQERVLGVLSIQSFKKNAYTEQHLSLLENLAAYTTIALDNANAYLVINEQEREVRERAAELVTINRITQALATQLETRPPDPAGGRSGARFVPRLPLPTLRCLIARR